MIRAADDVRDAEVEIVCDGCELVGGSSVRPEQRRAVAPEPHRPVVVAHGRAGRQRTLCGLGVHLTPFALPHRPFVEADPEPGEIGGDRLLTALDVPRRVGVVDP